MPFKKGEPSCRKYEPTPQQRRQVMTMTGFGIRQREVASVLGIDEKTLRLHFRRELDIGATEANLHVASSLFTMATKEHNVAAAIWWTKARMGWKETTVSEQTGPDGGPLTYVIRAPAAVTSTEEWLRLYAPQGVTDEVVVDGEAPEET